METNNIFIHFNPTQHKLFILLRTYCGICYLYLNLFWCYFLH